MTATNILPIAISILSALFSIFTYVKTVRHDKRQATLDAFSKLQNEVFDTLNSYSKGRIEEIACDNKSEEYKQITKYLSRIEHFSVGVNMGIYDLETTRRLAGEMLKPLFEKLYPIILTKRKVHNAENVYDDFENLIISMTKKEK